MKKIIIIAILVVIAVAVVVDYASNHISLSGPNTIKSSGITISNVTGKNYQVGISEGLGLGDKP